MSHNHPSTSSQRVESHVSTEEDPQENLEDKDNHKIKARITDLVRQTIEKKVHRSIKNTPYNIDVTYDKMNWFTSCPFCIGKQYKVSIEHGSKLNVSSLRNHIIAKHSQVPGGYVSEGEEDPSPQQVEMEQFQTSGTPELDISHPETIPTLRVSNIFFVYPPILVYF